MTCDEIQVWYEDPIARTGKTGTDDTICECGGSLAAAAAAAAAAEQVAAEQVAAAWAVEAAAEQNAAAAAAAGTLVALTPTPTCVHEECKEWDCSMWCECFDGTSCAASVLFFNRSLPAIAHSRLNLRSFFFFFFFFFLQRPRLRSTPPTTAIARTEIRAIARAGRQPLPSKSKE